MAKYIIQRLIRSILSIFIVVALVVGIVYKLVPDTRSFAMDEGYKKMSGNPKTVYYYGKLESLGYLDFVGTNDIINMMKGDGSEGSSKTQEQVFQELEDDGYTVLKLDAHDELQGSYIAYHRYNLFQLVANYFSQLFVFDHTNYIQDPDNPDLERSLHWEKDFNGMPALVGSGTLHKYLIYFDGNFPFIHQNFLTLNFGESFPMHRGVSTMDVISEGQGPLKKVEQIFPTGKTLSSPINQHTLKYKYQLDQMDQRKFTDHYADGQNYHENLSMIGTSYLFGILSLILTYAFVLPVTIAMAKRPGSLVDKIGIGYINLIISIPSLALIFFIKYLGIGLGLPDMFPHLGFGDPRSYILPIFILAIISTPGLMMWLRRYMVDQLSSDYIKFAKAKGLSTSEISRRHVFRNAVIPIVNGIPSSIILAISGAVLTETVFGIPGMGKMLPDAIKAGNNNMVITLTFIFTALAIVSVFVGDLLMTLVDPRIQLAEKEGGK